VNYLIGYTYLLTGCPLLVEPVLGGIRAFGPANLSAIGAYRAALGRDDAKLLVDKYVGVFAGYLDLEAEHRQAVEAHLRQTAESEIDPLLSATLSTCGDAMAGAP
jgi:hypothetical protein